MNLKQPPSITRVLTRLADEGYMSREAAVAALEAARDEPPADAWYMRALTIIGAWISAGFVLSFLLGIAALTDTPVLLAGLGALLVGAAVVLHQRVESLYLSQIAFVVSIVGSICVAGGVGVETESPEAACLVVLVVEGIVLAGYRDAARRLLATLTIVAALCVLLVLQDLPNGLHGVAILLTTGTAGLWWQESRFIVIGQGDLVRPVAYGLAISLLVLMTLSVATEMTEARFWWIDTVVLGLALLEVERRVLDRLGVAPAEPPALALLGGTILLATLTIWAPGVMASLLVLVLGYERGNRLLAGLALVSLVGFVTVFYYDLDLTLLAKSGMLAASGIVLLGLWIVLKQVGGSEPVEVTHG